MAWSEWPLIVVALLVGAAAGWVVRGRQNAVRAGTTGDATPASTTTTAVSEPMSPSAGTSTDTSRSRAAEAAPEQTPTAQEQTATAPERTATTPEQTATTPEQTATTPEQVDPAPVPEHTLAADSSQTEPADTDAVASPVVAAPPVEPDTEPADRAPVATEPKPKPEQAASELESGAADDFRRIQGVGPKMAAGLQAAGIRTYQQLAELDEPALRELIRGAGLRGAASLPTWPKQAKALAEAAVVPSTGGSADA
ncbi:hypothetical protein [Salinispora mooreana]|uniref:hypothetical protein n=1 Tax=Salinispora mooreana TaxID=999545 RepID=UPI0003789C33|nr:hypothetical protein [Salinispora mooreana]